MLNNDVMPWVIGGHAVAASVALFLGAYNVLRRAKGDRTHRLVGRVWMVAMYATVLSSFTIQELRPGHFSWIHGLSVFTFGTLTISLWAALTGRVQLHWQFAVGSYLGLVGAFIGAVAVPVRHIPRLAIHQPIRLGLLAAACVVLAGIVIAAARARTTKGSGEPAQVQQRAGVVAGRKVQR